MRKLLLGSAALVACALGSAAAMAEDLEVLDPQIAQAFAQALVPAADKIEKPQVKVEADADKACGVHKEQVGIILVPHQVVERLQNDSQLATVLADGMARALERQQYRTQGERKVAWLVGGMSSEMAIRTEEKEQSGRVSLALLHDAGYDIDQAPVAWWLLDPISQRPLTDIEISDRDIYLYSILGETWHDPNADLRKP